MMKKPLVICVAFATIGFVGSSVLSSCQGDGKGGGGEVIIEDSISVKEPVAADSISYKVYIENSGSMDGYVNGNTEFKNAVYSLLSDLKNGDNCKDVTLNYINSEVLKFEKKDISDFIQKLDPKTFKIRGGKRATSDLSKVIETVLEENEIGDVSVFVSDCIFSPGKSEDATQYLINQQIGVKSAFVEMLKKRPSFSMACYMLTSSFEGYYFDRWDNSYKIGQTRPYYIWLMGDKKDLEVSRLEYVPNSLKSFGASYLLSESSDNLQYSILNTHKIGSFERNKKNTKTSIINCKKDTKGKNSGKFSFTIQVNMKDLPLEEDYILNSNNYILSSADYVLSIKKEESKKKTYLFKVDLKEDIPNISATELKISLLNKLPLWVENINDETGEWNEETSTKTFGLKYLLDGVSEAYKKKSGKDTFAVIKVSINK